MWPDEVRNSRLAKAIVRFGTVPLVLFFYAASVLHFNYTPDDTYIYLQYARNIAEGNGFAFNAGEPGYGVTGPLWVLLIAGGAAGGLDPYIVAKTLDLLFASLALIAAFRLTAEILRDPLSAIAATAMIAADAWFLRWTGSGMETSLAVLLTLLTFSYVYRSEYGIASIVSAFLTLVRPEGILLFSLVQADNLINTTNRPLALRITLKSTVAYAALLAPWLIYCLMTFGTVLPNTLGAKSFDGPPLESFLSVARSEAAILLATQAPSMLFLLVGVVALVRRNRPVHIWIQIFPLAWAVVLLLFYGLAHVQVVSRYLLVITPLITIFGVWGVKKTAELSKLQWKHSLALLTALVVVSVGQNQFLYGTRVLPHLTKFSEGMEQCLRPMAYRLKEIAPPGSTVLAPDIGLVGYVSGVKVFDTAGLVTPSVKNAFRGKGYDEGMEAGIYREAVEPDFVIDRSRTPERLRSDRLIPVLSCEFPSLGITKDGSYYYTLYRTGNE